MTVNENVPADRKVALVTGAAAGIGKATAIRFAQRDYAVVVADLNGAGAAETVKEIESSGGLATAVTANVADPAQAAGIVETALRAYGRLDAAVNNAATAQRYEPGVDESTLLSAMSDEEWRRVMAVNLDGLFYCLRAELRVMREAGAGAIVNVSSTAALAALEGMGAYVASKMGVVGLTRTAAIENARHGIRVNAVLPGYVVTEMMMFSQGADQAAFDVQNAVAPMRRPGTPSEVAEAIIWLCAPESSYVTGIAMPVEGGGAARHPRSRSPR